MLTNKKISGNKGLKKLFTKKCLICGDEFYVNKNRKDTAKFCSRRCQLESNLRSIRKEKIEKVCPICSNKFLTKECNNNICCSLVCKYEYTKRNRITIKCEYCGKDTIKRQCEIVKSNHYFCSRECSNQWKILENNPNWKGGKSFEKYTVDWTETLRIAIRERDNYTCSICGKKQGDDTFDVHHIDYNKENCNTDNLITLCKSCHMKTNYNRDSWIEYFYAIQKTINYI